MANRHCSVKNGRSGSAWKHSDYISGLGNYADKGREEVIYLSSGNMPKFVKDSPTEFWKAADEFERKSYTAIHTNKKTGEKFEKEFHGRAYKEVEFSVPREITGQTMQVEYAKKFAARIVGQSHPYTLAVHDATAKDGLPNVNVHLMFSERVEDGIERIAEKFFSRQASAYRDRKTKKLAPADPAKGGAGKNREMNSREFVNGVRTAYQAHALSYGIVIDMRSNKERGLGAPEPKLGPAHHRAEFDPVRELKLEIVGSMREAKAIIEKQKAVGVLVEVVRARREQVIEIEITNSSIEAALQERKEDERIRAASLGRIGNHLKSAGADISHADAIGGAASSAFASIQRNGYFLAEAGACYQHDRAVESIAHTIGKALGGACAEIARASERLEVIARERGAQAERIAHALVVCQAEQSAVFGEKFKAGGMPCLHPATGHWTTPRQIIVEREAAQAQVKLQEERESQESIEVALVQHTIDPRSYYHPDKAARRESAAKAQHAAVAQISIESGVLPIQLSITLEERLAVSSKFIERWFKDKGVERFDVDTNCSQHFGPVVWIDEFNAIQKLGYKYAVHRLDTLDKTPALGNNTTDIKYHDGCATVTTHIMEQGHGR